MQRRVFVFCACVYVAAAAGPLGAQELERAFAFGSRNLTCATANDPATNYTMVHHSANTQAAHDALRYDAVRGWGYEVLSPGNAGRNGASQFGPFDESPNPRTRFPDNTCPTELYDSFIGAKTFLANCDEFVVGNREDPCSTAGIAPEGIIFRVDVPNGLYRFVAAVGSADNPHAHRILVEDGGEGTPDLIGENHVVLVSNYDQAEHCTGTFARVGFGCALPPTGNGPLFVDMDEDGLITDGGPQSPTLEVTEGYIRLHQLQANANAGACAARDANGGDMVLLEIWRVEPGAADGFLVDVARGFDPNPYAPGDTVLVTLTASGVRSATTIVETVPASWVIENSGGGAVNGNTITYSLDADGDVSYLARTPASNCGPAAFNAVVRPTGGCESQAGSTATCEPVGCGLRSSAAPAGLLIIGPIALTQNASAFGTCNDADGQGNDFSNRDYLTNDDDVDETNVLVEEGDELAPDFGGASAGLGVAFAVNPLINPGVNDGILTVWTASTDANGGVDFNLAANIGDPVDDYIVYSLAYLENTAAGCRDVVLEVGSDDAVKVRVNGALVHVNAVCRGLPAYGAGDRVRVTLAPGRNVVLIGVVERGGGTGVRLVVRDTNDAPLVDGTVTASCEPPTVYPAALEVSRAISPASVRPGDELTVTITASGISGPTTITDAFPAALEVVDAGGGVAAGGVITFTPAADSALSYTLRVADGPCPFITGAFDGTATPAGGACGTTITGSAAVGCVAPPCPPNPDAPAARLVAAFAFGARNLTCPTFNDPATLYTMVHHAANDALTYDALAYDPVRGWGYDRVWDAIDNPSPYGARNGAEAFGPFDASPNNRNKFPDVCPEELYDSFIGCTNFLDECSAATEGAATVVCDPVHGMVFRIDVEEPGLYRFVAAVGDPDNVHAHRVLVENGGEGAPADVLPEHVVLVDNYDQAQQTIGEADAVEPGEGVFARVGFDEKVPPLGDGVAPSPQFINMDENGLATAGCPNSPTLEVNEGYIRVHQLQGNSNDGPGGPRDPNGGDLVIFELWKIEGGDPVVVYRRGDSNANGTLDLTDGVFVLNFLFLGGTMPPCMSAADANGNGVLDLTDGVYILNFLFLGGPPPTAPGPNSCGPTPAGAADLGCNSYTSC